jgi:hypothetical protein
MSKTIYRNTTLHFRDGRLYIQETEFECGAPVSMPKSIDVTKEVAEALLAEIQSMK